MRNSNSTNSKYSGMDEYGKVLLRRQFVLPDNIVPDDEQKLNLREERLISSWELKGEMRRTWEDKKTSKTE
jgi:hypothetical protein